MAHSENRNDRTLFVGNIDRTCKEQILYELFLQAGPLNEVKIAKEKDGGSKGYAFIEFKHDVSVPYALHLLNGCSLYGRQLALKFRNGSKHEENGHGGPPAQAFPKGFPQPEEFNLPPNIQRAMPQLPMPNPQFDMAQNHRMVDGFRGSPDPGYYGSPHHQGQFIGPGPGSREHSPRWEGTHGRHERVHSEEMRPVADRRHHHHHRHMERSGHDRREEERYTRGRERSRTVDDHHRGHHGVHQRDRSMEEYRGTGAHRSNDGYRHHQQYR